ncbi:glycosyltransferase [Confluentibacter flavum]|uniref:Glycosyl transferase n=1 Tax=Confluentibacter flavum TaxID=1909700 RepID=A0A2N3HHW3_9FLAO|nr:glycosyltransferase [Confluentibacter flavum]PKQ44565.1 glycosyl transferase [Confluentibacter flavum]
MKKYINKKETRPSIDGKFLKVSEERFYIKGVTYGTFAPDENNFQFPDLKTVDNDFQQMVKSGVNTVRTYTVPSKEILDLALLYDIKIMIGLPWEQHLTFLDTKTQENQIIKRVAEAASSCEKHPAILCYAIGNEIPASIVRWYGDKKISNFLHKLYKAVKKIDPEGLVTYVNFPTTEYLELPFLDFDCFNVYLETKEKLVKYLARLHNLTRDKPLVLAEIGLDSHRNGEEQQAEMLDWQIRTIFEKGCAGAFVFSWTDEWWRGGSWIEDWDFGLVDRDRNPKPALQVIGKVFTDVPFASERELPRISVVVCSYNGASTIRDTMEGLANLDYPNYEVIVINDGSTDATPNIAGEYEVRLISTENRGLSNARNTGMYEASGEIIAYIDDDAYPDSQWLKYLASAYMSSDHGGVGGPNITPAGDGPLADCVANSPGRPLHVLTTDELAEHIPGCNMTFRRAALLEINGFDPVYRSAGDDVDACWRIQQAGYTIGFHPSAFVWHHCRNSIKMYWKQQQGYGKAEALLEKKWPEKYNVFGHLTWTGRVYGNGLTQPLKTRKKRIFYGSQGTALFQSVYQPATGFFGVLPLMPEWYLWIAFLGIISLLGIEWSPLLWATPLLLLSIFVVFLQAGISASKAVFVSKPDTKFRKVKYWGLTTILHIVQPIARLKGRIKHGLTPWRGSIKQLRNLKIIFAKRTEKHWSESWKSTEDWLTEIRVNLEGLNNKVKSGKEFDRWDIRSRTGLFASVRSLLTIEEHGGEKQYLKLKRKLSVSRFGTLLWVALTSVAYLAFISQAYITAGLLILFSLILGLKILTDIVGSLASVRYAMKLLSVGIQEIIEEKPELVENQEVPITAIRSYPSIKWSEPTLNFRAFSDDQRNFE